MGRLCRVLRYSETRRRRVNYGVTLARLTGDVMKTQTEPASTGRRNRRKYTPLQRFAAKVMLPAFWRDEDCWDWIGARAALDGRGALWVEGKLIYAYRFAYETFVGPIHPGLTLDHLCRRPCCVNPAHLDPCHHAVNCLRGNSPNAQNARKRYCPRGHPLFGENLKVRRGQRECITCNKESARRRWQDALALRLATKAVS